MATGNDQHIEKKTLDDYYGYIRAGADPKNPFDFFYNKDKNLSQLRKHCLQSKDERNED